MKNKIIYIITAVLILVSTGIGVAAAHEGHDEISRETAIKIANKSVQQLTFTDLGYQIGKLDSSWKSLKDNDFDVVEASEKSYVVSATNNKTNNVIYFEIAKNGKVLEVKGSSN